MERIRLVVVSHDREVRTRFRAYAEAADWIDATVEEGGHQVLRAARRPDVVLIDDDLPGLTAHAVTTLLLRDLPGVRVITLVPVMDFDHLDQAVRAGGATALSRHAGVETVIEHIRAVVADEFRFHPWPVQQHRVDCADGHVPRHAGIEHVLTSPQAAVLDCVLCGLNTGEMTRALGMTEYALRKETLGLFAALGVEKKVGAIAVALERRWTNVGRRPPSISVARASADSAWFSEGLGPAPFHALAEVAL